MMDMRDWVKKNLKVGDWVKFRMDYNYNYRKDEVYLIEVGSIHTHAIDNSILVIVNANYPQSFYARHIAEIIELRREGVEITLEVVTE